jgi:hypothetical protein
MYSYLLVIVIIICSRWHNARQLKTTIAIFVRSSVHGRKLHDIYTVMKLE